MTFEEAVAKKNEHSEPYFERDGIWYEIFIMPQKKDDIAKYRNFCNSECFHSIATDIRDDDHGIRDEDAKEFSTDGQFSVGCVGKAFFEIFYRELSEIYG